MRPDPTSGAGDANVQDGKGPLSRNGRRSGRGRIDGTDTTRERGPSLGGCDLAIGRGNNKDPANRRAEAVGR